MYPYILFADWRQVSFGNPNWIRRPTTASKQAGSMAKILWPKNFRGYEPISCRTLITIGLNKANAIATAAQTPHTDLAHSAQMYHIEPSRHSHAPMLHVVAMASCRFRKLWLVLLLPSMIPNFHHLYLVTILAIR